MKYFMEGYCPQCGNPARQAARYAYKRAAMGYGYFIASGYTCTGRGEITHINEHFNYLPEHLEEYLSCQQAELLAEKGAKVRSFDFNCPPSVHDVTFERVA